MDLSAIIKCYVALKDDYFLSKKLEKTSNEFKALIYLKTV